MKRKELRRYPRVLTTFPVECDVEGKTVRGHASTLGGGGMFLMDPQAFPQGLELSLRFRPARHLPFVKAKARICYVVPGKGSGVEFTQINPEAHQLILRLIHHKTANRRKYPRVQLATQIYTKDDMSLAFSRDISLGGMFIETREPGPIGSEIDLRFHLDDGGPVVLAAAEIKYHVAKLGMGVSFIDIAPGDRKRIEAYIAKKPALPEPVAPAKP